MTERIKRILAFFIDWNIVWIPLLLISGAAISCQWIEQLALLTLPMVLIGFCIIICRDAIFKGQSLGKRIFGLRVYDKNTLSAPSVKQCILRNAFFFLYFIDGIMLMTTGETIGDRAAKTIVLSEKTYETFKRTGTVKVSPQKKRSIVITIVVILAVFVLGIIGLTLSLLESTKDSDEYKVAYSYLVDSDAFQGTGAEASDIFMNQYSRYTGGQHDNAEATAEFGFMVNFRSYQVVCHKIEGVWQVCPECTQFD